ncbi:RagB/SusD family nutrient uptake outer membrane protein [Sphingobacterium sp. CZ-2]|mgnify:CR=1 FL=1|uniref:RagB/SusD family nutrient uptake outer membrane protein n=1 Tax=Sphingobacterium sp. CZ-2 TaxID=2557994 RepID=UPI00106FB433|nr:RagB/SusD family nutrient uptake outer membrane protein [Sphingobacterium sp. CZ-2]QBR13772.1 RagB/SusD family nutrient uptake outer membrane protein [Sphingobacterium sp. CZ-2]
MKKFKNIYILPIAGLMCFTISCKKGFLDRFPQTLITPEVFFKTEEDLSLYMNGMVSLHNRNSYLNDQSTDNASTTGAVEIKNMMTGSPSSQTITGGWSWGRLRNINYFLENYTKASVSDEIKNHYAGLARYYRAIFYYDMVKRYSNVPWYDKTLNASDAELKNPQNSREEVMTKILEDLDFAVKNVRENVPTGTPGKWAVTLMQAKIALHEGTYRKYHAELKLESTAEVFLKVAESAAQEIIKSGKFSIYNSGKPEEDYATLFESLDLTSNKEVILVNAFDQAKNVTQNVNSVVFGDYEQSPSRDLVQSYLMKDGSRFTAIAGHEQFGFVQEFKDRDPRLSQTLIYPTWLRQPGNTTYIQRLNKNFTGYHQRKGYVNSVDQNVLNGIDFPVHRYAEVLLILAEAKAELGIITQTDLDNTINILRKRVGMPNLVLVTANASPDPALKLDFPMVQGSNVGTILEIRRERRVELAFENTRYDDLMRWNAGKLLENIPQGMYFPGVGNYDMNGDGVPDIKLIPEGQTIPSNREKNSLGVPLVYYTIGRFGGPAGVYLSDGTQGGTMVTEVRKRTFVEPMYYYRPIPEVQMILNPILEQPFGWK